jgi:hypothetical protein
MKFRSAWWATDLPDGWSGRHSQSTVEFWRDGADGLLIISAVRKSAGPITTDDLRSWASERPPRDPGWANTVAGEFVGISRERVQTDVYCHEFFVASGPLMLYITYTCPLSRAHEDQKAVTHVLAKLTSDSHGA